VIICHIDSYHHLLNARGKKGEMHHVKKTQTCQWTYRYRQSSIESVSVYSIHRTIRVSVNFLLDCVTMFV
jgi:hypothetical protein